MPLLRAGLFGGSVEKLEKIKSEVDKILTTMAAHMRMY